MDGPGEIRPPWGVNKSRKRGDCDNTVLSKLQKRVQQAEKRSWERQAVHGTLRLLSRPSSTRPLPRTLRKFGEEMQRADRQGVQSAEKAAKERTRSFETELREMEARSAGQHRREAQDLLDKMEKDAAAQASENAERIGKLMKKIVQDAGRKYENAIIQRRTPRFGT